MASAGIDSCTRLLLVKVADFSVRDGQYASGGTTAVAGIEGPQISESVFNRGRPAADKKASAAERQI
jgi:hypothetical protein